MVLVRYQSCAFGKTSSFLKKEVQPICIRYSNQPKKKGYSSIKLIINNENREQVSQCLYPKGCLFVANLPGSTVTTYCTVSSFQIGARCSGKTETPSITDLVCVCKAIIILLFHCVCSPGFVPKLEINNFHYYHFY